MTRVLATLLGAKQPSFRLSLNQLEKAGGMPGVDIRLTTDILHRTQDKIRMLGLDPKDTTPEELYHALKQRLVRDEQVVRSGIGLPNNATNTEMIAAVVAYISELTPDKSLVMKNSVARQLLKKQNLAKTMALLGYRSSSSMIKSEPVAQIFAAAHIAESEQWWQDFRLSYGTLRPGDFEMKRIGVIAPTAKKWQIIGANHAAEQRHNIVSLNELGSVVLLPIANEHSMRGLALVMLLLTLEAVNDIRASSSYLKFQQVRTNFGATVADVSRSRVYAAAELANQPIAWQALHRFYARNLDKYPSELFEPHLQSDDLSWHTAEHMLVDLDETLDFWQDSQYCGLTDEDGTVVSLNIFDATLNYCNDLPFIARISQHIKQSVWHELTSRYLNHSPIEKLITDQLIDNQPDMYLRA